MDVGKNLDAVLAYLIEHPDLNNINAYTIQKAILGNSISLIQAKDLFEILAASDNTKVYGGKYLGKSPTTEHFLAGGGYQKKFPVGESKVTITASDPSVSLFLSYCWKQKDDAETIFRDLSQAGVRIRKDDHELSYKDSIHDYMGSIRTNDFALVLISDDFLRSRNCMNEMMHLYKELDAQKRMLPVLIDGTLIYRPKDRAVYIKYWENELESLQQEIADVPPYKAISLHEEVRTVTEISMLIDTFLNGIVKEKNIYLSDLQKSGYAELHNKIGVQNLSYAFDLLRVSVMEDAEERELALYEYAVTNPLNDFYWGIMAATAKMSGRFKLAEQYYLKSLEISPVNIASLNNLGMLYLAEPNLKDLPKAKKCFEQVIALEDKHTIARLNLADVLLQMEERGAAFEQNNFILSYDPLNSKAHSNIGNYYRSEGNDLTKAEEHYKIAIEADPEFADVYLNYGNFLKTAGRLDEGNALYKKLLKMKLHPEIKKVVEYLLNSEKA